MSAVDAAVEVVAEVVADASCIGGDHIAKWPISMHGSTKPLPYCGRCFDAALVTAKDALEALSGAGFLATEEEWGVRNESGRIVAWRLGRETAVNAAESYASTDSSGEVQTGTAEPVSRHVTPWRSA